MTKAELAQLIDAYADSKASGNKYLTQKMIEEIEIALNEVCDIYPPAEVPEPPHKLPPLTPPGHEPEPAPVPAESLAGY